MDRSARDSVKKRMMWSDSTLISWASTFRKMIQCWDHVWVGSWCGHETFLLCDLFNKVEYLLWDWQELDARLLIVRLHLFIGLLRTVCAGSGSYLWLNVCERSHSSWLMLKVHYFVVWSIFNLSVRRLVLVGCKGLMATVLSLHDKLALKCSWL